MDELSQLTAALQRKASRLRREYRLAALRRMLLACVFLVFPHRLVRR